MELNKINFPETITSNRVVLRKLLPGDKTSLFEIYSNKEAAELDDWIPFTLIKEAETMIEESNNDFKCKTQLRYGIVDVERKILVGSCGIFGLDEWNKKCMIFYQVHHDEYNKGYASDSVKMLVDYIFNELKANRIEAYITPGNIASIRVLEKNGFIYEGLHREVEFYKGQFWDGILMAILSRDYFKEREGI